MIEDDLLQELKRSLDMNVPGVLDTTDCDVQKQDNQCTEVVFSLRNQMMIKDLIEIFQEKLKLIVLSVQRTFDKKIYHAVCFSELGNNQMFTIELNSIQYGMIDEINVISWNSIEKMFSFITTQLVKETKVLNRNKKIQSVVLIESKDLWNNFFNVKLKY